MTSERVDAHHTHQQHLTELVALAQSGDRNAMERLLAELYAPVASVTRRICGSDADDATQNAVISIVRALPQFDRRSSVTTWAYRIATNAALDELRRRQRRAVPADLELARGLGATSVEPTGPSFEDSVADHDLLERALAALSPEFRVAVVLRDVAGMDYADIADTLEVPIGTVRSRIARGRRTLATLLTSGNQAHNEFVQPPEP